uniref:Uncharacterized protein n=1 Tax=Kalanchoe fedtschenkoi TaxID=63787 RepID=A0A7N0UC06_KALFE
MQSERYVIVLFFLGAIFICQFRILHYHLQETRALCLSVESDNKRDGRKRFIGIIIQLYQDFI